MTPPLRAPRHRHLPWLALLTLALVTLAGPGRAAPSDEAAAATPPAANRLLDAPDPEPVVEPIRSGGPNKPYAVGDQIYVPDTEDRADRQVGLASWYAHKFHGRRTASGEVYNLWGMTAAHVTLPIPSYARIRNPKNGRAVIVRINDRGPFAHNRVIDLSWAAAAKLDLLRNVGTVEIERITEDEIRSGRWKAGADAADAPVTYEIAGGERLGNTNLAQLARLGPFAPLAPAARKPAGKAAKAGKASPASPPEPTAAPDATPEATLALATPAAITTAVTTTAPAATPAAASAALKTLRSERAGTQAARGWWLQLGAFKSQDSADGFYQRLGGLLKGLDPLLTMFQETQQHKVQAGPFDTREEAARFGTRLRELLTGLTPTLVERK
jgi:rare lipoprotein A